MTTTADRTSIPALLSCRSEVVVLLDQLRGIEDWTRRHRTTDIRLDEPISREARLDFARQHDVVERQRRALTDWTARQLRESVRLVGATAAPRAVLVHRNSWFKSKVAAELAAGGVTVVADLENGADAIGIVIAEQPDLLILEDKLPMVAGLDATRTVREYSPSTVIVVQVESDWEIGPFLEAGAAAAYTRRVPPADIAADLTAALVP